MLKVKVGLANSSEKEVEGGSKEEEKAISFHSAPGPLCRLYRVCSPFASLLRPMTINPVGGGPTGRAKGVRPEGGRERERERDCQSNLRCRGIPHELKALSEPVNHVMINCSGAYIKMMWLL